MKNILAIFCSLCSLLTFAGNYVTEYFVTMKDGVKLYTVVSTPEKGKKLPVIISRSPYAQRGDSEAALQVEKLQSADQCGYVEVFQHCRGTGKSEGDFIPFVDERADGLELLEWVRKQDFYNGEIYLAGSSYGATVHAAWLNTPQPDIKGIFWGVQDSDRYNIIYRNGFLRLRLYFSWYVSVFKKNSDLKRDREVGKFERFPLAGISKDIFGETAVGIDEVLLHPDRNDPFWKTPGTGGAEYTDSHKNSGIPTFFAGSWHDIYVSGMFDMWRSLTPEHRKIICRYPG